MILAQSSHCEPELEHQTRSARLLHCTVTAEHGRVLLLQGTVTAEHGRARQSTAAARHYDCSARQSTAVTRDSHGPKAYLGIIVLSLYTTFSDKL